MKPSTPGMRQCVCANQQLPTYDDDLLACCEECQFWHEDESECRRYPPTGDHSWPKTNADDQCGEWFGLGRGWDCLPRVRS